MTTYLELYLDLLKGTSSTSFSVSEPLIFLAHSTILLTLLSCFIFVGLPNDFMRNMALVGVLDQKVDELKPQIEATSEPITASASTSARRLGVRSNSFCLGCIYHFSAHICI